MNYLQFDFETIDTAQSEQLVALLNDLNFEGFEEDGHMLRAFIAEENFNENEFNHIVNWFPALIYTKSQIENINWNQKWEEGFTPVIVENKVAIRAGFHEPIKNV